MVLILDLWSSLEAVFSFKRLNGFYLLQILAPSNFLVILSWISFLINPDHAPARVFLGTSCVLTMAAIQNYINMSLPKVGYLRLKVDFHRVEFLRMLTKLKLPLFEGFS